MLGFEPRSRQHDTGVCSPLHHIGKAVAVNPKKVPSLCSLVTEEIATYILQPVDWLSRSADRLILRLGTLCRAFFVELHVLVSLRWTTAVNPVRRSWFSECSTDEVPIVLEHDAHFCVGTAATPS